MNRFKLSLVVGLSALLGTSAVHVGTADACGVKLVVKSNRRPGQKVAAATNRKAVDAKAVDDRTAVGAREERTPVAVGPERPTTGTEPIEREPVARPVAPPTAVATATQPKPAATAKVEPKAEPKPEPKPVAKVEPKPEPKPEKPVVAKGPPISLELYFDLGSREVSGDSASVVTQVKDYLAANPGARLVIEGHTDPSGSPGFNQRLSVSRANTVRAMLIEQTGAKRSVFTVKGFGESKLAYDESDSRNRRVVIRNR